MFNKSWKLSFSFNKVFHIETTHYRSSKKFLSLKYYAIDWRISQKRRSQHSNRLIKQLKQVYSFTQLEYIIVWFLIFWKMKGALSNPFFGC